MSRPQPIAPDAPQSWGADLRAEYESGGRLNGRVGQTLLAQTEAARIWAIRLLPGERVGLHRHQLNYVWTALCDGESRSHYADGRVSDTRYHTGMSRSFQFAAGECMIHDLRNTGTTPIEFLTVEFLNSANPALPID